MGTIDVSGADTANATLSSVPGATTNINNGQGQTINIGKYGTIDIVNPFSNFSNKGVVNLIGNANIGNFSNVHDNAILNIIGSNTLAANITNDKGKILIGDLNAGGDLSSSISAGVAGSTILTNNIEQEITVLGDGTIGASVNKKLIKVINYGIVNLEGSDINISGFENNSVKASLNINKGVFNSYGNVINSLGSININGMNNSNLIMQATTIDPVTSVATYDAFNRQIINSSIIKVYANNTVRNNLINCSNLNNNANGIINLGGNISLLNLFNEGNLIMAQSSVINKFTYNGSVINNSGNYTLSSTGVHVATFSNNISNTLTVNGTCNLQNGCTIIVAAPANYILDTSNDLTVIDAASLKIDNVEVGTNSNDVHKINLITNSPIVDFILSTKIVNHRKLLQAKGRYLTMAISRELPSDLYTIIGSSLENLGIIFSNNQARITNIARNELSNIPNLNFGLSGYNAGGMQSRDNVWIKGLIEHNNQHSFNNSDNNIEGYKSNSNGLTLGTDREMFNNFWTGVSASLVKTKVNNKLFSKYSRVNSYQSTLYASYSTTKYYLDLLFNLGFNRTSSVRYINSLNNLPANAKFNAFLPAIKIVSGYIYKLRNWLDNCQLIPNGYLRYAKLYQFAYQETGIGGFGLKFEKSHFRQLEGGIGVKLSYLNSYVQPSYNSDLDGLIFKPSIYGMIIRDLYIKSKVGKVEFIGGGDIGVASIGYKKLTYNLGIDLNIIKSMKLSVIANYNIRFNAKFIGHQGNLLIKYEI